MKAEQIWHDQDLLNPTHCSEVVKDPQRKMFWGSFSFLE